MIDIQQQVIEVELKLQNVTYTVVTDKKEDKVILNDVNVSFRPKEVVALMGPSGSGKTTLLSVLLGNISGRVDGHVLINGQPVTRGFKSLCNFVPQEDVLLTALTPRETLMYAGELRLPQSCPRSLVAKRVDEVLRMLSIDNCADTQVGSVDVRGISGGQRKRVSIAMELLTNPSVLLLDEPTSGLDSKTAEDVVRIICQLGHKGHSVVCTIHQPSYHVFRMFDKLVLLTAGRMVYNGPVSLVESYFDSVGFPTPERENPADFFMRLVQDDTITVQFSARWAQRSEYWVGKSDGADRSSASAGNIPTIGSSASNASMSGLARGSSATNRRLSVNGVAVTIDDESTYPTSRWFQAKVLLRRTMYDTVKDKTKFSAGVGLKLIVGVLVGVVWYGQADSTNKGIFPTTGALFLAVNSCIMDTLFGLVMLFPAQQALLRREYNNGMYSLPSYFLGQLMSGFVFQCIYCFFLATPLYFLVGLEATFSKFIVFYATLSLTSCVGVAIAFLMGPQCKDFQTAQQAIMPTLMPMLLFAGYLIPYTQIHKVFRWLYWSSFWQYGSSMLQINEFKGLKFKDCTSQQASQGLCFATGEEYLASIHIHTDDMIRDLLIVVALLVGTVLLSYVSLKVSMKRRS